MSKILSKRNSPLGNVLTPSSTQVMQGCCQSPSRGDALWRTFLPRTTFLSQWTTVLLSTSSSLVESIQGVWGWGTLLQALGLPPAGNFPHRCLPHSSCFQRWPLLWLWRPAPTLHGQWFGHQSSLTDLMKLLVKHLQSIELAKQFVQVFPLPKQTGQLKNSPFSIIRTHTRKQGHGTKLAFNQLAVTPQTFCLWMAVFYWQSRILSKISVHITQPVLSQTFHWTSFSFLQLLRVKEGSWKHLSQECCVSYK